MRNSIRPDRRRGRGGFANQSWLEQLEPRTLLSGAHLQAVVVSGDPASEITAGSVFDSLYFVGIGAGATALVSASVKGAGVVSTQNEGLYLASPNNMTLIHRELNGETDPVSEEFGDIYPYNASINGHGIALAFLKPDGAVEVLAGSNSVSTVRSGIGVSIGSVNANGVALGLYGADADLWIGGGDALKRYRNLPPGLDAELYYPDASSNSPYAGLINQAGQTLVFARGAAIPGQGVMDHEALWLVNSGGWVSEVYEFQVFPSHTFANVHDLSDSGAALVTYHDANATLSILQNGTRLPIIGVGAVMPGGGPTVVFSNQFSRPRFGGGNQVAMYGYDTSRGTTVGIWAGSGGALAPMIRRGDAAPGLPAGATFARFDAFEINSSGQIAFAAAADVGGVEQYGIWVGSGGSFSLVATTGQTVDLGDERIATLQSLSFPGGSFFNDEGMVAFGAILAVAESGDLAAIVVADPNSPASTGGAIGGFIWNDLDADGLQDAGEPGVGGVVVKISDPDIGYNATVSSNGNGRYRFDGLPAGDYDLTFTAPDGTTFTRPLVGNNTAIDSNADGSGRHHVTLPAGAKTGRSDVGLVFLPEALNIHGTIWFDSNKDGSIGSAELPAAAVNVALLDAGGATVASLQTGEDGTYIFDNLEPGTYRVRVTPPTDANFSPAGIDAEIGGSGLSDLLTVAAGGDIEADAGLFVLGLTATLISGDIDLTTLVVPNGPDQPAGIRVTFESNIGIATDSLPATSIRLHGLLPQDFWEANFKEVVDTANNGKRVTVLYQIDPVGDWSFTDLGDFTVRMATPVRDTAGNEGLEDELVGLMSLVDLSAPTIKDVDLTPSLAVTSDPVVFSRRTMSKEPNGTLDPLVITFRMDEQFDIDSESLVRGNVAFRRIRDGAVTPMDFLVTVDDEHAFKMPLPEEFQKEFSGDYELITGTPEIRDKSGNKIPAGQVLDTFTIDLVFPRFHSDGITG